MMGKRVLILGPFPLGNKGLNGQTIANETLYQGLSKKYDVKKINTSKSENFSNKSDQGKFKLAKFLKICVNFLLELKEILFTGHDIIYMTPGQSFLGFMRFSPYMLCSFIKKEPCYIHIHGGAFRKNYENFSKNKKKLILYLIKRLSGVIALGESLKYMFEGLIDSNKIHACENGVQDEFVATVNEIKIKKENFKKEKKIKLLYLSNLMEEKGILDILKASEKFTDEEIEINLAGAIEPNLKNIVEDYLKKYDKKLFYHGIVSGIEKKKLLLENYIFILPTYYSNEGQPISILEAYVNGCSVITTSQGGILDVFEDNINGKLCKMKDVESIYNAILYLKDKDKFIDGNYKYGKEKFLKSSFVERIENILL